MSTIRPEGIRLVRMIYTKNIVRSRAFYEQLFGTDRLLVHRFSAIEIRNADLQLNEASLAGKYQRNRISLLREDGVALYLQAQKMGVAKLDGLILDPDGYELDPFAFRYTLFCRDEEATARFYLKLGLLLVQPSIGRDLHLMSGNQWIELKQDGTAPHPEDGFRIILGNEAWTTTLHGLGLPDEGADTRHLEDPDGRPIVLQKTTPL